MGNKALKKKLQELLDEAFKAKSYVEHEITARRIAELVKQTNYFSHKKLDCHAALDFLKAAEESFSALAGDLKETVGKLDPVQDSRQPVLRALKAKMERLVGEMQEAYTTINRS